MKPTTAVLIAGTAVSAAVAAVGIARVRQEKRTHADRTDIAAARVQMDWLTQVATNQDLAKLWAPEDMSAEDYMPLLHANRSLCALTLINRLGLISEKQRTFYAAELMKNKTVRAYWDRFGGLRAEEAAVGKDARDQTITAILDQAARDYPAAA
ncbi:DUF6082 family protein [Streptomyces sp. CFMR 7]|uniref:DUF6082 family protein n=1 Tax=Streptomyces sp. CFMR 7 TaxID=1649184 RepID=UPI0011AA1DEE|nr:DUF6082 family protein [Streptomyces sp. CFMR 7]